MKRISIENISKKYGHEYALDHVCLNFEFGKIYGLLGRNGAGKSTLLNVIANRIFPAEGAVTIDELPAKENDAALSKVYLMNDSNLFPKYMKIKAAFLWTERFYGGFDREFCGELCQRFKLNPKKKISSLSTGYRSIFKLILALCVKADYILLDEPVLGLDANHRELFYKMLLRTYAENPRTFIISTHIIEEIAGIIEDVVIIKKGVILTATTTEEILTNHYTVAGPKELVLDYLKDHETISSEMMGGLFFAYVRGQMPEKAVAGLTFRDADLQQLFIRLTANEEERGL